MNLETTYLGMRLPHPLIVGAGPLGDDLDRVRALEDAGGHGRVLTLILVLAMIASR